MVNIFKEIKENKKLKKELEKLNKIIENDSNKSYKRIETESLLRGRIDDLLDKQVLLQKEIVELSEKNYELANKLTNDITGKIKEFINELEHNIQVDKSTDELLISGVACDYVIEKLKDIIK